MSKNNHNKDSEAQRLMRRILETLVPVFVDDFKAKRRQLWKDQADKVVDEMRGRNRRKGKNKSGNDKEGK